MRVIDPKQRAGHQRKRHSSKPLAALLVAGIILGIAIAVLKVEHSAAPQQNAVSSVSSVNQNIQAAAKTGALKQFSGEQFRDLYNNFAYPNTKRISEDTPITGNVAADVRIRNVAVARGYMVRSAPVTDTFQDVGEGYMLQQRAAQPWLELKAAAKKDGLNIGLTAAYRAADDQKQLFMASMGRAGLTPAVIAAGAADNQVSQLLRTTAIPGFSRHHTGYTIDISCKDQPAASFEYTTCFKWLGSNNYEHAKTYGWIPSYPPGAGNQGPDPEPWEYVWVGKDAVSQ
jgi:LAS superfamily LD-carboxypeptidase LdcB